MTQERMLSDAPPTEQVANVEPTTFGSGFTTAIDGFVTHLRFWHVAGCGGFDHQPALWLDNIFGADQKIGTVPAAIDDAFEGWIEVPLPEPVLVQTGKYYVTAYSAQSDYPIRIEAFGSLAPSLTFTGASSEPGLGVLPTNGIGDRHFLADVVFDINPVPPEPPADESKGLTKSRQELMTALEAADIRTYYGMGKFSAPCARIFPAEPWVEIEGRLNGRRVQSWEVWAVAGRTDSIATFDELEAMVMAIDAAIDPLQSWSHPTWRRPAVTDMGGAKYFACRGTIETIAEVH